MSYNINYINTGGKIMSLSAEKYKLKNAIFILEGLNCPLCASKITEKIDELPEVEQVEYNIANRTLAITGNIELEDNIINKIQKIAAKVEPGVTIKRKKINRNGSENISEQDSSKHIGYNHKNGENNYYWRLGIGSIIFI